MASHILKNNIDNPSKSIKQQIAATQSIDMPKSIRPMLATLVDKPFDKPDWLFEIKWDGYRALAFIKNGEVELKSRNDKSFNEKFYPIYDELKKWKINTVIDGEIVVLNEQGIAEFEGLQSWRSEADGQLVFYVFDILWLDGHDLTTLTLRERHEILKAAIPASEMIRISEAFETSGTKFFETVSKMGLEGIIAKNALSTYQSGERTTDWLKIKANKRQEVVIGGFTNNEGSNKPFSSLLVGVYQDGKLQYTGKIGTGFNKKSQDEMMQLFKPLVIKKSPFTVIPDINKPSRFRPNPPQAIATWLKPQLVCEVSYAEMTSDGVMRHPSFEGMRTDKKAIEVVRENATDTKNILKETNELTKHKAIVPVKTKERKTLLNPSEETQVRNIGGYDIKFTNLSKIFWPKEKVTKRDMLNYYYQVAPYILPYLKNRPQSLNRHPHGINGESFYQKDVKGKAPDWVETFPYHSDADNRDKEFLVCTNEAGVLYMASLGCIELNPWSSTILKPDNPTWCIIDLDPDKNSFNQVIEAANVTHKLLDAIGVPNYCKTSGSTGLHIYIPLGEKYSYEDSKEFGRAIAKLVHAEIPKFTSIERLTSNRNGKMYIDFLQNRPQATLAAPYSLRPKPGAPVSMPLHWEEVKKGMKITDFNIFNAMDRIKNEGDIFKPVLGKGINMQKALKQMAALTH
ncbi:MAG: DNA ligase D [Flavipsychrobacter sp.]